MGFGGSYISIHALVKRATSPLYGCDTAISISIHALVKRATKQFTLAIRSAGYFNPRPRKEGDIEGGTVVAAVDDFNPRPRKEGDRSPLYGCDTAISISIHALVKRATR